MSSMLNQAERRQFLLRLCCHLSRELVLDDGFGRMTKKEATSSLAYYLDQYEQADKAVRLGNGINKVSYGADESLNIHNDVMYSTGCPWRTYVPHGSMLSDGGGHRRLSPSSDDTQSTEHSTDGKGRGRRTLDAYLGKEHSFGEWARGVPSRMIKVYARLLGFGRDEKVDGRRGFRRAGGGDAASGDHGASAGGHSTDQSGNLTLSEELMMRYNAQDGNCSLQERSGAVGRGLFWLSMAFTESVHTVLKRYGVEDGGETDSFLGARDADEFEEIFQTVVLSEEKLKLLETDDSLRFIISQFEGDLYKGMTMMVEILDEEVLHIIHTARELCETFFACFCITIIMVFYGFLFRRTISWTKDQMSKIEVIVTAVPIHTLDSASQSEIIDLFKLDGEDREDEQG
mmetsp:Transcript_10088/g.24853  ORF Transcript_10088/g.24853 Transcript_10088/m.24853 type:complete len:401 (+) Transcript_10088:2-1204(+)